MTNQQRIYNQGQMDICCEQRIYNQSYGTLENYNLYL